MSEPEPLIKTVQASQAHREWSQLLGQVSRRETRVVVEQDGIPVAAIVSAQDLEQLRQLQQQQQRDLATLRASHKGFKDEPVDEVERQIARALAEVRAERTAARRSTTQAE